MTNNIKAKGKRQKYKEYNDQRKITMDKQYNDQRKTTKGETI